MSEFSKFANSSKPPRDKKREALLRRRRDQDFRAQRAQALADPGRAPVPPVGMSVSDFVISTGLSRATIYRYIADGRIKAVNLHARLVIPLSELDRFRR